MLNQMKPKYTSDTPLDTRGIEHRKLLLNVLMEVGRGHIGSAFSILEAIRVIYDDVLKFKANEPLWKDRDRFILSKGHGCLALYLILAEKNFFPKEELFKTCTKNAMLGGHPEFGLVPGVEASTGSLGHGPSIGVGHALSAKMNGQNYHTYVMMGDGECQEGSVWEAALNASKHKLNNLTFIIDYNKYQCYSKISDVLELEPFALKWEAFGFQVEEVDGHDVEKIKNVFAKIPFSSSKPNAVILHTIKGKGVKGIEGNPKWHHKSKLEKKELESLLEQLNSQGQSS